MWLNAAFIKPSENTQMWRGETDRVGWKEDVREKRQNTHYHNLKRKIHLATNSIYSSSKTRVFAQILTNTWAHAQMYTSTVFRCHLAPDPQPIMKAARKQCWGARSDRANKKQATFCIPGQAVQHNTDTGRATETDHLLPKTIHLPCSPQMGWAAVNRFFCASRHSCHLWWVEAFGEKKRSFRVGYEFIVLVLFGHFHLVGPSEPFNSGCQSFN